MSKEKKNICVFCDYARMRDDICGIYCVGECMKKEDGTCDSFKAYQVGQAVSSLSRRLALAAALRCCGSVPGTDKCEEECSFYMGKESFGPCIHAMTAAAADMLENHQSEVDALQVEIGKLRERDSLLTAEHDAAVEELEHYMVQDVIDGNNPCSICANASPEPCEFCNPKWRGPQKGCEADGKPDAVSWK